MDLLFYSLVIQLSSLLSVVLLQNSRTASAVSHSLLLVGLILGFAQTLGALIFSSVPLYDFSVYGIPNYLFRFDALGLYFLGIAQLVAIPTTIYSYSAIKHYGEKGKHHSEETRRKISEAHKGMIVSEETRRKMIEAQKKRRN